MTIPKSGIIPPLATPLASPGTLDLAGLERVAERATAAGATGLFVLGTTGEAPSLPVRLKRELIQRTVAIAAGRVPVLVGLLEACVEDSLELADFAAAQGATGLVLTPPFYFPMTQAQLIGYAERLIPRLPLPVYLYNIPVFTKVLLEPETIAHLCQLPQVCGAKDSGGDLERFARTRKLVPHLPLLWGPEERLLDAMDLGADGGVTGGANLFPELYVGLYEALRTGDRPRAEALNAVVQQVSEQIYSATYGGPAFLLGMKCALELLGLASGLPAEPLTTVDPETRARIQAALPGITAALQAAL
ncbi:MAG: dihydrodipicolinate synthase family protein [Acidobacteria bacterium]|nr:dihydrodipicolinate synthase family protein [Acidobacteriota bacterium]